MATDTATVIKKAVAALLPELLANGGEILIKIGDQPITHLQHGDQERLSELLGFPAGEAGQPVTRGGQVISWPTPMSAFPPGHIPTVDEIQRWKIAQQELMKPTCCVTPDGVSLASAKVTDAATTLGDTIRNPEGGQE